MASIADGGIGAKPDNGNPGGGGGQVAVLQCIVGMDFHFRASRNVCLPTVRGQTNWTNGGECTTKLGSTLAALGLFLPVFPQFLRLGSGIQLFDFEFKLGKRRNDTKQAPSFLSHLLQTGTRRQQVLTVVNSV